MAALDGALLTKIKSLCDHGDKLAAIREYSFAVSKYYEALGLIPDPKRNYKAATWVYSALGETYWKQHDYNNAGMAFLNAYRSAGGSDSGIINLRLGACLSECGENTLAHEYLCQAYMLGGEQIFADGCEKYYEIIRADVENTPKNHTEEDDKDDFVLLSDLIRQRSTDENYLPVVADQYDYHYDEDDYSDHGYSAAARRRPELYGSGSNNDSRREFHDEFDDEDGFDDYDNETGVSKAVRFIKNIFGIN